MKTKRQLSRVGGLLALSAVSLALAGEPARSLPRQSESPAANARHDEHDATTPDTAEEHLAKAESYRAKAAAYRKDADEHRKMLAEYKKRAAFSPKGDENSWVKKMRLHCQKYIEDAEALAREADKFAEYHTMRAAEVRGQ